IDEYAAFQLDPQRAAAAVVADAAQLAGMDGLHLHGALRRLGCGNGTIRSAPYRLRTESCGCRRAATTAASKVLRSGAEHVLDDICPSRHNSPPARHRR